MQYFFMMSFLLDFIGHCSEVPVSFTSGNHRIVIIGRRLSVLSQFRLFWLFWIYERYWSLFGSGYWRNSDLLLSLAGRLLTGRSSRLWQRQWFYQSGFFDIVLKGPFELSKDFVSLNVNLLFPGLSLPWFLIHEHFVTCLSFVELFFIDERD